VRRRKFLRRLGSNVYRKYKLETPRIGEKLVALAVQSSLSLANIYRDDTEEDTEARLKEFVWSMQMLQSENRRQRSLPDCSTEQWGWIPDQHDRVKILTAIGAFAEQIRPKLALTYYLEALPVYSEANPDSLEIMLRIGRMVRDCVQYETPFSLEEIVHQADIWFNKIITIRPSIPRNLPPSEKYVKSIGAKDDTYTLWGWDRKCDLTYVQAIWELGLNQITLDKSEDAEKSFDKALQLCDELELKELQTRLKKARLEMQGKIEEAKNPYFWDDITVK